MEIIFTQDSEWLQKWDEFVTNEDKASHLMLSNWVHSYESYGFESEFCLALDAGKIVGGYAAVIAKVAVFKFYIVPFGPIVANGFEHRLEGLIALVPQRGKLHKAAYAHMALPVSGTSRNPHLMTPVHTNAIFSGKPGHLFTFVYSSNGLNWVPLDGFESEDAVLESFRTSVRRDIRASMRKGLSMKFLLDEDEVKSGYELCLENASKNNYALRDWNSFRPTLMVLIANRSAKFIAAYKENEIKGVVLLVKAANFYTYILGGSKKEKPDLLAGHFLQWHAILLSLSEKCDGYNISLGGSKGVVAFKNSFNTEQIVFTDSKFHWILRPAVFKTYLFIEKRLKPHKRFISKLLSARKRR